MPPPSVDRAVETGGFLSNVSVPQEAKSIRCRGRCYTETLGSSRDSDPDREDVQKRDVKQAAVCTTLVNEKPSIVHMWEQLTHN